MVDIAQKLSNISRPILRAVEIQDFSTKLMLSSNIVNIRDRKIYFSFLIGLKFRTEHESIANDCTKFKNDSAVD